MKKLLFLFFIEMSIVLYPQKVIAASQVSQQMVQFPVLLQGTTLPLQAGNAVAWQSSMPISFSNENAAAITDDTPILFNPTTSIPTTIYTDLSTFFSNTQTITQPSSNTTILPSQLYTANFALQPITDILLQGNTTPNTNITITSSAQ